MATTITANGINFPDGSAGSPSIGGTDTNTGLFTGSDIVGFATGGSERLRIDASGNINIANDSGKLQLGTSADLKLFHNGSENVIEAAASQHLYLKTDELRIISTTGTETFIKGSKDGAVELYHNNVKRFETDTDGVRVVAPEGAQAMLRLIGDEGDDNNDYFRLNAGGGTLKLQDASNGSSWEDNIVINAAGSVELYYDNSKKFETTSSGATLTGDVYATGKLGIGTGASTHQCASGGLDLRSVGAVNKGALFIGADAGQNSMSRSSNTEKQFRMMMPSYADPDNGITVLYGEAGNNEQLMNYGGATGWAYAINGHRFYAASNTTTATGSLKATIDSDGLKFNGDTSSANALDDYEEGTWTPAYANVTTPTYDVQTGRYTKVGRFVYCTGRLSVQGGTALDTSDGSGVNIGGLPFTGNNDHHACLLTLGRFLSIFQDGGASVNTVRFNGDGIMLMTANGNEVTYTECNAFGDLTFAISYQL